MDKTQIIDDWGFYTKSIDDNPCMTRVNLGLSKIKPIEDYKYVHQYWIYLRAPLENGLPTEVEKLILWNIENLILRITSHLNNIDAGVMEWDGKFVFFSYSQKSEGVEDLFSFALKENFPGYSYWFTSNEDEKWDEYYKYLFPDKYSMQEINNYKLIDNLKDKNDNVEVERPIEHWIYFKDMDKAIDFADQAKENKYNIISVNAYYENGYSASVCVSHNQAPVNVEGNVWWLMELADSCEGDYSGWACSSVC